MKISQLKAATKNTTETVLITGATSGIGKELAKCFARAHYALILVARDKKSLTATAKEMEKLGATSTHFFAFDLTDTSSPQKLFTAIQKAKLQVDILVNNAGFGTYGKFWELDTQRDLDEIQVNVSALTSLTRLFLPGMVTRKKGKILNLSSIVGFFPGPLMAVYYATKSYVLSFSVALNEELRGTGVSVSVLCPNATQTKFVDAAKLHDSPIFQSKLLTAEQVAKVGFAGLMAGKTIIITDPQAKFLALMTRLLPRTVFAKLIKNLQTPKH